MKEIWEEKMKLQCMLEVEIAVCEQLTTEGSIPKEAMETIKEKANFDAERIREIEKTTKHDVIAFLTNVAEYVGEESCYIHLGLTSSDVLDTGLALQLSRSISILADDIKRLKGTLKKRALEHKNTLITGRTHGMQAEPTTLGHKLAIWYGEFDRAEKRIERVKEIIGVGKISGAVGVNPHISPQTEEAICLKLGLKAAPASSQIIQRDRHADFLLMLALTASSISKVATEVRHLQRSEVGEAEEFFSKGQKGSSAMPHKRNPVVSEQLCGLARIIQSNASAALQNVSLWHERDISHSSVERVILPDSSILLNYMLNKLNEVIENWVIYDEKMKENYEKSNGLLMSEHVMLALIRKSKMTREEAYGIVQKSAMKVFHDGDNFIELLKNDPKINKILTTEELQNCFNLDAHFKNIENIFKRVFDN